MLITHDGGVHWNSQASAMGTTLNQVRFVGNSNGWALGDDGTIVFTKDGGVSWQQASGLKGSPLNSICMTSQSAGWVVGDFGLVAKTTDGGKTWQLEDVSQQRTSAGQRVTVGEVRFNAVYFVDAESGWIVGDAGVILATSNGGKSWSLQEGPIRENLRGVYFRDRQSGWAVGENGVMLSTQDGGKTWALARRGKSTLNTVIFVDDNSGWATGAGGVIMETRDGGKSWQTQSSGTYANLTGIQFVGTNHGFVFGGGSLLETDNTGGDWHPLTRLVRPRLSTVQFVDSQKGWAVGEVGALSTEDGGRSWRSLHSDLRLNSVCFINGQTGWAAGQSGIVVTADGGKHWHVQRQAEFDLDNICFINGTTGWASDWAAGQIIIWRTVDGGNTWESHSLNTSVPIQRLYFSDAQRGWALGKRGSLWSTEDAGVNWILLLPGLPSIPSSQPQAYWDLFFVDRNRGWVIGDSIWTTDDGGKNWHTQPTTETGFRSVHFVSPKSGWAVGWNGTIVATGDGGETWQRQVSGTKEELLSVCFFSDQVGWAVGADKEILSTHDGGHHWEPYIWYHREPAFAYFVCLGLSVCLFVIGLRKISPDVEGKSIADVLVDDAILNRARATNTQVGAIAEGLANYLENPQTKAPLVIAITGPWGSGKSSLMNVLRESLNARGFQTAWFNAWHNQSEEYLFAALLASLRGRALPPWWTPRGIVARERLFAARCGRMWLQLLFGLAAAVFLSVVAWKLAPALVGAKDFKWTEVDKLLALVALPVSAVPIFAVWQVFKDLGANPLSVFRNLRGPTAAEARAAISLRQRFAEEFAEVTSTLTPRNLTIFIDDIDRCRPDQILVMMEAINFLATAGACFIVLGVDRDVLMHCLEQKLDWLQDLTAT